MLNVLFYHANDVHSQDEVKTGADGFFFLSVAALYFKTHIDICYPDIANEINWLVPIQHKKTDTQLINLINKLKPDVICTSHYIWNNDFLFDQLKRIISKINPQIVIIAGGPSINVNINAEFFNLYPFVKYAIYGAGEMAIADAFTSLITKKKLISFNTSNIAWVDNTSGQPTVAEFKYVPQSKTSPYLHNKDFFKKIVHNEKSQGFVPIIPYELTRGCPYSCTFCDWNSGLSNKVTRRKNSYKEEIDLFHELGIQFIYLADANVGQYDEDVEVIEYLAKKNIHENANFKTESNLSKLRKDNNLKIYHLLAQGDLIQKDWGFTFSIQDINSNVLENIDRPDVTWDVNLRMINELKQCYPDIVSKIQLIIGLPGQTVNSWRQTLSEVCRHDVRICLFLNELLPASPAALDWTYREKFQFTYSNSERFNGFDFFRGNFAKSCLSYSAENLVEMLITGSFYCGLTLLKYESKVTNFNLEPIVDYFLCSDIFTKLKQNLLTNWLINDKFYYTINFNGNECLIPACHTGVVADNWIRETQFAELLSNVYYNENLDKHVRSASHAPIWFPSAPLKIPDYTG